MEGKRKTKKAVKMEKRKNTMQRAVFNKVLQDLRDILTAYEKIHHYNVIQAYFKAYNISLDNSAKGRLLYILGEL